MSDPLNDKILAALNKQISDPGTRQQFAKLAASVCQGEGYQPPKALPETPERLNALRQDGLVVLGKRLDAERIGAVLEKAKVIPPYLTEGALAYSPIDAIVATPHLITAATDPDILALASAYIGAPATIVDVSLWQSLPNTEDPAGNQVFHRDRAGFRTCKLFIYLTRADANSGAHQYVLKSHDAGQTQAFLSARGYSPEQIAAFFAGNARTASDLVDKAFEGRIATINGEAGGAFMTDNYGLHRGRPVESGSRWVFVAVYGVSDQRGAAQDVLAGVESADIDSLRHPPSSRTYALRLFGGSKPQQQNYTALLHRDDTWPHGIRRGKRILHNRAKLAFGAPEKSKAYGVPRITLDDAITHLGTTEKALSAITDSERTLKVKTLAAALRDKFDWHAAPTFVLSHGRSGTTALQRFLEQSQAINPVHGELSFHHNFEDQNEFFYAMNLGVCTPDYLVNILEYFSQQFTYDIVNAAAKQRPWVVTSHGFTAWAPLLRVLFPDARFVYLKRDLTDVFFSRFTKMSYEGLLEPLVVDKQSFEQEFLYRKADWDWGAKIVWYIHTLDCFARAILAVYEQPHDHVVSADDLFATKPDGFDQLKRLFRAEDLTLEDYNSVFSEKVNEKKHRQDVLLSDAQRKEIAERVTSMLEKLSADGEF